MVATTPTEVAARPFLANVAHRNRVSERDRARLAAWYVAEVESGNRNPARALADRFPESSYGTWRNRFLQLRTETPAFLTAAPRRGVAGGVLTPHAERVLGRAPAIPDAWRETYESTRRVYAAPVRRERRTDARPKRSAFDSDVAFDRAFDAYLEGEWYMEVPAGPETVEDPDDWLLRVVYGVGQDDRDPEDEDEDDLLPTVHELIEGAEDVHELRKVWVDNRSAFAADPSLLDAYKSRGRTLTRFPIYSPQTPAERGESE